MITRNDAAVESSWQRQLAEAISTPEQLLTELGLDPLHFGRDIAARKLFPMRVPRPFVQRMRRQDASDPLLRQVLPSANEFDQAVGYIADPLVEHKSALPGVMHKYSSRVLLMIRTGCAVNCRYCFRRHFPYQDHSLNHASWQDAFDYIAARPEINEVIYSGGDPLMAKDPQLAEMTRQLEALPQLKRLRIHTRLPVVIPSRINRELLDWLGNSRIKPVMVLHINHPNEIDADVEQAVARLKQAGVWVLNQSVLLKGINDQLAIQVALSERLFEAGIQPYYLHLLDKVAGAAHFDLSEHDARKLMQQMLAALPGFLVPKLVREVAEQPSKLPLDLALP